MIRTHCRSRIILKNELCHITVRQSIVFGSDSGKMTILANIMNTATSRSRPPGNSLLAKTQGALPGLSDLSVDYRVLNTANGEMSLKCTGKGEKGKLSSRSKS